MSLDEKDTLSTPAISPSENQDARPAVGCSRCATQSRCPVGGNALLRAALEPSIREHRVAAGTVLQRQGETAGAFVIVKVGTAYLRRNASLQHSRAVAVAGRGFALGMCSFLRQPSQVSCVAASAMRVCTVPTSDMVLAARQSVQAEARIFQIISDNYALLARWAEAIGTHTITARVAASILLLAEAQGNTCFTLPPHVGLAELLGTTRESVARAITQLEASGCLQRSAGRRCEIDASKLNLWMSQHR